MAMNLRYGAQLMRTSLDLVRSNRALLWFPVVSTICFAVTTGFWIMQGAWLYWLDGSPLLFVPLVAAGLYSLTLIGIFFNVALVGAADAVLDGREASFATGMSVAMSRLGSIAGWAAYSLFVSLALGVLRRISRLLGATAEIAWNFATFFVVPAIALDGLDAGDARQRSFQLARKNWQAESGGLGALRAVLLVPGLVFAFAAQMLDHGSVHSTSGRVLLGLFVVLGFTLFTAAGTIRQVFATWLYRLALQPQT